MDFGEKREAIKEIAISLIQLSSEIVGVEQSLEPDIFMNNIFN